MVEFCEKASLLVTSGKPEEVTKLAHRIGNNGSPPLFPRIQSQNGISASVVTRRAPITLSSATGRLSMKIDKTN